MGNKVATPIIPYDVAVHRLGEARVSKLRHGYQKITQNSGPLSFSTFMSRVIAPRFPTFPPMLSSRLWAAICLNNTADAADGRQTGCSWEEFCIAAAVLLASPAADRAAFLFEVYDLGKNGTALISTDLITCMAAILFDRPKSQADYTLAVREIAAAAGSKRLDMITKEEWRTWCITQAATPGAWEKHPLTGWMDYVSLAFQPDASIPSPVEERESFSHIAGRPTVNVDSVYAHIRSRSEAGVLDASCFLRALHPLVPRSVSERVFLAADVGRNGALSAADFREFVSVITNDRRHDDDDAKEATFLYRMYDTLANGRLRSQDMHALIEAACLCSVILRGSGANGDASSYIFDTATGRIHEVLYAQAVAASKAKAKQLMTSVATELELDSGVTFSQFKAWLLRRPEAESILSLVRRCLHIDCGLRMQGGVLHEMKLLVSTMRPFTTSAPIGSEWYVIPAAWVQTWLDIADRARKREGDRVEVPPMHTATLCLGPATQSILRPGLNQDLSLLASLAEYATSESLVAPAPRATGEYVLVPPRSWHALARWYGVHGPAVCRRATATTHGVVSLELYPPWMRAFRLGVPKPPAANDKKPAKEPAMVVPHGPPSLMAVSNPIWSAPNNLFIFSMMDTVHDVVDAVARAAMVPAANVRLWVSALATAAPLCSQPPAADDSKSSARRNIWPFKPLFGGDFDSTRLFDLDVLDDEGACVVLDIQSPMDGKYASVATGYASIYFNNANRPAESDVRSLETPLSQRRHRGEVVVTPYVYPGALTALPPSTAHASARKGRGSHSAHQQLHETLKLPAPGSHCALRFSRMPKSLVGLSNLGNTCYLNSALQCLLHTPMLAEYFMSEEWAFDINPSAKLGTGGVVAASFSDLVHEVWNADPLRVEGHVGYGAVAPRRLKHWLSEAAPRFAGNEQHDSQEAFATLLSFLAEDLNRVKEKPYVEQPDSNGRPDHVVAEEWWIGHLKREQSLLSTLFTGQFKSVLTCDNCGFASSRFEPFTTLSLPLPESRRRCFTVTIVFPHAILRPLVMTVVCEPWWRIADVKQAIAKEVTQHCRRVLSCQLQALTPARTPSQASFNVELVKQASISENTGEDADTTVSAGGDIRVDATAAALSTSSSSVSAVSTTGMNGLSVGSRRMDAYLRPAGFAKTQFGYETHVFAQYQPKYEQLLLEHWGKHADYDAIGDIDVRSIQVTPDKLVLVRGAGHSLLETSQATSMSSFISGGASGSLWEVADDTPLGHIRDADSSSYIAYVSWNTTHYRSAYRDAVTSLGSNSSSSTGQQLQGGPGVDTSQFVAGSPVWAQWKNTSTRLFPAWITATRENPVDSDDDAEVKAKQHVCSLWYEDGDVDDSVPITDLRPREPTLFTLACVHRCTIAQGSQAPFNWGSNPDPSVFTYGPALTRLIRLPGAVIGSPSTIVSPTRSNGEAIPRLPYGIGSLAGIHGVGGPAYASGYGTTMFPTVRRATFGTPILLKVPPAESCEHLYAIVAHQAQRFIRRNLPKNDHVLPADAPAETIMAKWGFALRKVQANDPHVCSHCSWLKSCSGCVIPAINTRSVAAVRLHDNETLAIDWDTMLLEDSLDKVELVAKDVHQSVLAAAAHESTSITLDQCFDVFSKEEKLEEAGYCPQCSKVRTEHTVMTQDGPVTRVEEDVQFRVQTKQLQVWRMPPILVVQLKRFQHNQYGRRKLNNLVQFPVSHLSLQAYVAKPKTFQPPPDMSIWLWLGGKLAESTPSEPKTASSPLPATPKPLPRTRVASTGFTERMFDGLPNLLSRHRSDYALYGVVSHHGMLGAGHYVAFARSFEDDQWYCFNDRNVYPVTDMSEVVSPAAYMLFYVRKDIEQGWLAALNTEKSSKRSSSDASAPLDAWDLFPHKPGTTPVDVSHLKAQVANAGLAAEALGFMDSLADKCAIM